jgi:hypothetical protein
MPLHELPLDELVELCRQANHNFLHSLPYDERYPLELFRRALLVGDGDALDELHRLYFPQFLRWVRSHPAYSSTDETDENFASEAFWRFYNAVSGGRFNGFKSMGAIMTYAKLCCGTAVGQYARDHKNTDLPLLDTGLPDKGDPLAYLHGEQLWNRICKVLRTARQRHLAYLVLVLGMKPAEIVKAYPEEWTDERSVSIALFRIRKLLRADPEIRNWKNE